jgi:hypothetical protein
MALWSLGAGLCGYITRSNAGRGVGSGRLPIVRRRPVVVSRVNVARIELIL